MMAVTRNDLRRTVRVLVAHYASTRPEDYETYMLASSVCWFLGGRPGLTLEQQEFFIHGARGDVEALYESDPLSQDLIHAFQAVTYLETKLSEEMEQDRFLKEHAEDFALWAKDLETADPED